MATTLSATAVITPSPTPYIPVMEVVEPAREVVAEKEVEPNLEQEAWLAKLEQCESGGRTTVKVLDTNGKYSYGRYQFQAQTWLSYGKQYGLVASSTNQVEPLIFDGELQKQIAHKMLADGGRDHWFNCSRPLGKYPR